MMKSQTKTTATIFVAFYALFVLIAIYHLLAHRNFIDAASSLGIGLIFDPFDTKASWNERKQWQKAWLLIHLSLVFMLFALGIFN